MIFNLSLMRRKKLNHPFNTIENSIFISYVPLPLSLSKKSITLFNHIQLLPQLSSSKLPAIPHFSPHPARFPGLARTRLAPHPICLPRAMSVSSEGPLPAARSPGGRACVRARLAWPREQGAWLTGRRRNSGSPGRGSRPA